MILRSTIIATLWAALVAIAGPAPSTISGQATIIDGDSLRINNVSIRLFGIDAVELHQTCTDAQNRPYNCGMLAADVLAEEIAGAIVVCFPVDIDRFKRTVAVCTANDQDLSQRMVERGFAVDYEFFSGGRYAVAEKEAREAKRGLHVGSFQNPRQWREEHRR